MPRIHTLQRGLSSCQGDALCITTGGGKVSTGVVCSGDFADGGTERFEKGADQVCLTNLARSADPNNILDTYSTADYVTGTHCMTLTQTGTEDNQWVMGTAAGDDTNGDTLRFYLKVPEIDETGKYIYVASVKNTNTQPLTSMAAAVRVWYTDGTTPRIDGRGTATIAGPEISVDTWYRVEFAVKKNAASTLKVYAIGGAQVGSTVDFTAADIDCDYWYIGQPDQNLATPEYTVYWDNVKLGRGAMTDVGADE